MASTILKVGLRGSRSKASLISDMISDVYAGWMHKNLTDEQRRQKSIWSYIMALASAHATVHDGK